MSKVKQANTAPLVRAATGQFIVAHSLTDPSIASRVKELTSRMTSSPEASIEALKRIGILNRSGKLSRNYGGR